MENGDNKSKSKRNVKRLLLLAVFIPIVVFGGWYALARIAPHEVATPVAVVKQTTDNIYYAVKEDDLKKAAEHLPPHVNILVTGLDCRLGQNDNHADAIHLFTIFPDNGRIEITSVPRDTKCFIDSLFPDSLSHFSNARSKLGRKGYIHTAEMFLNKGKIDYWIEMNFSTVMGVLQLIGYKDPATALQYLRARKAFPIGDVQRSHNQAVFMRDMMIKYFELMNGMSGDFLLTAGLGMIETNLTKDVCQGLLYKLKQHGFPNTADAIALKMDPPTYNKFQDVGITPENAEVTMTNLMSHSYQPDLQGRADAVAAIETRLAKAARDSAKPYLVLQELGNLAEQHGWLQVTDLRQRDTICDRIEGLMCSAYHRMKKPEKADALRSSIENEKKLFRNSGEIFAHRAGNRDSTQAAGK